MSHIAAPMSEASDTRPFIVLTAIMDASARAAAVTLSHGDAWERAQKAAEGLPLAGLELVEVPPIAAPAFAAMRKQLGLPVNTVGVYDVFPLANHLSADVRRLAGQFLGSEALWMLSEQGLLGPIPFRPPPLDIPKDWDRDPKKVHDRLVEEGALNLTADGIQAYKQLRDAWEAMRPATPAEAPAAEPVAAEATA